MSGWRVIPGFEAYEAHADGKVRRKGAAEPMRGHLMKTTGYWQVMLAGRRKMSVHRLIAMAFCDGYRDGLVVNHKNGDRADNRADNLEWVTHSENAAHSFRVLGRKTWTKGVTSAGHPTSKAIVATNMATGEERIFACALDAVRAIPGLDSGSISRCCRGKISFHKGYWFKFHTLDPLMEAA